MNDNRMKKKNLKLEIDGNNKIELKQSIFPKQIRNYGIDLLKIISMINIINLHINLFTPLLNIKPIDPKYKQIYRLEAFSYWAVDAFGLISGIVSYKKYKFVNIIYIWFEYFFYSVTIAFYLYYTSLMTIKQLFYHFFPIAIRRNWYVNAYFLMYFFLPFITNSINSINKNLYSKFILCFLFIYSIYNILIKYNIGNTNFTYINNGYSSLWLLILYIAGAYIGRFYINQIFRFNIIFLLIYFLFSFFSSEYIFYSFKKNKIADKLFLEYFSPTIIIQALSLIFFFSNLKIKHKYLIKTILFFNPLNFNVTLIHSKIFMSRIPLTIKLFNYVKSLTPDYFF